MTDLRTAAEQSLEALKGALEAVEHWASYAPEYSRTKYVLQEDLDAIQAQIDALKAALAEPVQEPVAVRDRLPCLEDLDENGRCWWHSEKRTFSEWYYIKASCATEVETHWMPAGTIPLPKTELVEGEK